MKRTLSAALVAVLALAACSSDSSSPATTVPATTVAASTTAPSTSTTTTVAPAPDRPTTIDELLSLGRPIVLAHTAGEDQYPASTMYGFAESVAAGVDMLDLNVQLSKDGELVVHHDDSVDRSTDGTGKVADLTLAELQQLDDAYWFTADCGVCNDQPDDAYLYRGIRTGDRPAPEGYTADDFAIPTLREVIERFPDLPLNIEIKGEGDPAKRAADVLAAQLTELGREEASVVASFSDEVVSYFHSIAPEVEVSPGLDVLTAWVLSRTPVPDGMRILQLPPEYSGLTVITPELVVDSNAAGYPIWVWPNNRDLEHYDSYLAFLEMGVVGLNINFPAEGVRAVVDFLAAGGS